MWKLSLSSKTCPKADAQWVELGVFETVKGAAQRVRELEGYPVPGVFFQILVETEHGSDEEFFAYSGTHGPRCSLRSQTLQLRAAMRL